MRHDIPFPDDPMSGLVVLESPADDLRPGDIVRVMEDGKTTHAYELLSIREDQSAVAHDTEVDEIVNLDKDELQFIMERDETYHWTILNREIIPIQNHPVDTLTVFIYTVEAPTVPDNAKGLVLQWAFTPQRPVENMPDPDGMLMELTFEGLRQAVSEGDLSEHASQPSGDIQELHDKFTDDSDIQHLLDLSVVAAEYNAQQMFEFHTEPTYDEEMKRRLEREAQPLEEAIKLNNSLYR